MTIFWINYIFSVTLHLEMKYNTYTFDNGLRIIHLPSDSKVVYCGYQINAGTRNEEPGEEGLAHFLRARYFQGHRAPQGVAHSQLSGERGGDLNAYTNKEGHGLLLRHPQRAHRKSRRSAHRHRFPFGLSASGNRQGGRGNLR